MLLIPSTPEGSLFFVLGRDSSTLSCVCNLPTSDEDANISMQLAKLAAWLPFLSTTEPIRAYQDMPCNVHHLILI